MPDTWSLGLVAAVAFAVSLYGFSKTAIPGVGMLGGVILAIVLPPAVASGFMVPLLIVGDLIALSRFRQHADWKLILRLIPGVVVGMLLTAALFIVLTRSELTRLLGFLILLSVVLELLRRRGVGHLGEESTGWAQHAWVGFFGALTGMTTMAANAGGPAMTLYLIKARVSMLAFMGTSAWFFFIVNVSKVPINVPMGLINVHSLVVDVWFLPALLIGAAVGVLVFKRLSQALFMNLALALSALGSVWLLIHG